MALPRTTASQAKKTDTEEDAKTRQLADEIVKGREKVLRELEKR